MAKGFWVKTSQTGNFKKVTGLFVKVSPSTWQSINDAWVKVKQTGTGTWQKWWESATNPDTPIEILTSYTTTTELLRLQGKNYHWTPSPSTLFYTFTYVDNTTSTTRTLTSSTSTSNPTSGSSITIPTSTTYRTISKVISNNEFTVGGLSTYKFTVTGTTSGGSTSVQTAEYSMRTPAAPTVTVEKLSGTSVKLTITSASTADFQSTYRYIVYTSNSIEGLVETGGGRGGYAATSDPTYVTLTGLTAGRTYDIYVAPFTGSSGSTTANASGYPGVEGYVSTQTVADYTFAFGNTLYVGTNGYVSLDSGSASDSISGTSGRVIGILPGDLYQDTASSIWYWSDSSRFVIRWEGYHYNQTYNLRQYEIVFTTGQNYASVYAINVTNTTEGTDAYVKDGVTKTNYPAALGTGAWRYVYFDAITNPTIQYGPYITTSKSVMKQVIGLTAGTQDVGYTSIVTSTNQNTIPTLGAFNVSSFIKGTVGSSSQGAARTTTLSWGSSSGATAYQIQYFGSNDNVNWTTVQAFSPTNNIYTTSDTKTWSTSGGNFGYYTFMKASVRALESTGTATYVYSDNGTYTEAAGVAPGQPTFGTITTTGTTASIPFTVGTQGTNYLYTSIEYNYRLSYGSYSGTWSTSVISSGAGTISLSGLSPSTTYYIKIRTKNYDELYSAENETNFSTISSPQAFNTISGSKGFPSGATQTAGEPNNSRTLSVSWNASSGSTDYEVQYEGSSNNSTWTVLRTLNASPYIQTTYDSYVATYYKHYRFTVRARAASHSLVDAAYSDGGSSTSYMYQTITGTSPQPPTIGTITPGTTTASAAFAITSSPGSNTINWNQWSLDNSSWTNIYSSPISITGLSVSTGYYLYMRSLNYDDLYSSSTYQYFTTNAAPAVSVNSYPTISGTGAANTNLTFASGSYNNASTITKTLYASTSTSFSTGSTNKGSSSPYGVTSSDAAAPAYYFAVLDTVLGTNGITYYFWSGGYTGSSATIPNGSGSILSYVPSIIPTISMLSNTGVSTSGATINWSSSNQSYATVDGVNVGSATSYAFTGKSASTTYSGTVIVYSSTGNSTSASYSFTTSTAFTAPSAGAPALQFLRTSGSSRLDWYCDYPGISGNGTITGMDFEIRTTAGGGTLLASGTRAYPGAGSYPYSAAGTVWAFRMGTANGDISYSASARYGRARVNMLGSNGTTYYGTWSGWI